MYVDIVISNIFYLNKHFFFFFLFSITLSDNINNSLTAFESYLDDKISESDNFHEMLHPFSRQRKSLNILKIATVLDGITSQLTYLKQMS